MPREGKVAEFGKEFHEEGKDSQPGHHVDTSTGGKAEIPEPQTKSDAEKIAEGFLDPDDDVGTEEKSLSFEFKQFPSKPSLKALELNIKDGELGLEITEFNFKPHVQGMHAKNRKGSGPPFLMHKVNVITPAEAAFYSSGNSNRIGRSEIAFIDLRRKDDTDEKTDKRIPGAKNWPLNDKVREQDKYFTDFDKAKDAKITEPSQKDLDVQKIWQDLYDDPNSVVHQVASDPAVKHVVFHCYQSTSRTPPIARAYWQFMTKKGGRSEETAQKVYALAEGFFEYSNWVEKTNYTEGREFWV